MYILSRTSENFTASFVIADTDHLLRNQIVSH